MAKVYEFPTKMKRELPKEIEERLYKIAKDYVDVLYDAVEFLSDGDLVQDDFGGIDTMIVGVYLEGIAKAIEELEE